MSNFEDKFLRDTFNEQSGNILEKSFLATIDDNKYIKNIQEKLEEIFITKNYSVFKNSNDPVGLLLELKKRNPQQYQELKNENLKEVKKFIEERVSKNRHKFLQELSLEEQFKIIEKSQAKNSDPTEPLTDFADDLHATIAQNLDIDYSDIEYYTAVKSHLDFSGVDAFLKFKYLDQNGQEKKIRVCLDISGNSAAGKAEQEKAKNKSGAKSLSDLIIFSEHEQYNRKRDKNLIKETAQKIIEIYKEKIKNMEGIN